MIITPAQGAVNSGYSGTQQPIIQNLGPGVLYVGTSNSNLTTEGIYLPSGSVYELPKVVQEGAGALWLQADGGNCDVRIINIG
jgi:hypothetical protein